MSAGRTIYVHAVTRITRDFGTEIYRERGICFSWDNDPARTFGFEINGRTVADVVSAVAADAALFPCPPLEVVEGVHVMRVHDMNPHGLV